MSSMEEGESSPLTVTWRIENIDGRSCKWIRSPPICVLNENCDLWLLPKRKYELNSEEPRLFFYFLFSSENRNRSKHEPLNMELLLIRDGGSLVSLDRVVNVTHINRLSTKHFEVLDGMIRWNEHLSLPMDAFAVLFRVWSGDVVLDPPVELFVRTRFGFLQAISYDWTIENYGNSTKKKKKGKNMVLVSIPDVNGKKPCLTSSLSKEGVWNIVIDNLDIDRVFSGICNLRLLDADGSFLPFTSEHIANVFYDGSLEFCNTLPVSEEDLMENKKIFLSEGILRLHCEIHLKGITYNEIEEISYGSKTSVEGCIVETKPLMNSGSTSDSDGSYGTHPPYVVSGSSNSYLSTKPIDRDFLLRAGGEIFPVHRTVLAARSPFFKSVFENGTMDTASNVFELPDLDADTLYGVLVFVYTDSVDDLQSESAKRLLAAARKYQLPDLQQKCRSFLKSNLSVSDACAVLVMADENQEDDLKAAVVDLIFENDEIISSDVWSELKENHPKLAADTLQMILLKTKSQTARYAL